MLCTVMYFATKYLYKNVTSLHEIKSEMRMEIIKEMFGILIEW